MIVQVNTLFLLGQVKLGEVGPFLFILFLSIAFNSNKWAGAAKMCGFAGFAEYKLIWDYLFWVFILVSWIGQAQFVCEINSVP